MTNLIKMGTVLALLLMGTMAGFFFAFSFVAMPGFDQTKPLVAIEAMQGINRAVRNAVFFVPFFLTPAFALILSVLALISARRKMAILLTLSGCMYLVGGLMLTMLYHVPMNETLATLDVQNLGDTGAEIWQTYSKDWTPWNTVRMIVCFCAMLPLVGVLMLHETNA